MSAPPEESPCWNLQPQYLELKAELDEAVLGVPRGRRLSLGPEVAAFEEEFASYVGADHGHRGGERPPDALDLAVSALGLGPGDEVRHHSLQLHRDCGLLRARAGVRPAFADIDPRTFNLDPQITWRSSG